MSYNINININKLSSDSSAITNIGSDSESLDNILTKVLANQSVNLFQERQDVMSMMSSPKQISNPEVLYAIQQSTSDYNFKVSLYSALSRKVVSAVETLLRA